jgi:hypothetical protein
MTFASGRDALAALIQHGVKTRAWRRCFVPSYYCADVVTAILGTGIHVLRYEDSPLWLTPVQPPVVFQPGDAFLLVNYFGLRTQEAARLVSLGPADLLEDHTHDPWSDWAKHSTAAYCFASLRKTLPIPDGATLWSPLGLGLPDPVAVTPARGLASQKKLAAMILKSLYLQGEFGDKPTFRRLQLEGETEIGTGPVSAATPLANELLSVLPWDRWRGKRAANYQCLAAALGGLEGVDILTPFSRSTCPFAVVLHFNDPEVRGHVRDQLTRMAMYTAVHWPLERDSEPRLRNAQLLSERLVSLPCDYRFDACALQRVAAEVRSAIIGVGRSRNKERKNALAVR